MNLDLGDALVCNVRGGLKAAPTFYGVHIAPNPRNLGTYFAFIKLENGQSYVKNYHELLVGKPIRKIDSIHGI